MILRAADLKTVDQVKNMIAEYGVSFFDFGCSHGANIDYIKSKTGFVGLGFDIDEKKLQQASRNGHLVCDLDIMSLPDEKFVDYVFFSHMLEHLFTLDEVRVFVEKACAVCKKQILIKQPYIDSDLFLFQLGLKSGYSHWTGHRVNLTTPVLFNILNDLKKKRTEIDFMIFYNLPIADSNYKKIFAVNANIDSVDYDDVKDIPKPRIRFNFPHFHQINAVVFLGNKDNEIWPKCSKPDVIMYDSRTDFVNRKLFLDSFNRQTFFNNLVRRLKIHVYGATKGLFNPFKKIK
jgi:hypothetical protein